jgi:hypothetical protein
MAEADPVLQAPLEPGQLDLRVQRFGVGAQRTSGVELGVRGWPPLGSGNARESRSRACRRAEGGDLDASATRRRMPTVSRVSAETRVDEA